jgi:gas vesicle protein
MAYKVRKADALMLVGGSVVGAGLALLLAPYSGTKSRKKIVHLGKVVSKKSDRALRDFSDSVSGIADTISEKAVSVLHIR